MTPQNQPEPQSDEPMQTSRGKESKLLTLEKELIDLRTSKRSLIDHISECHDEELHIGQVDDIDGAIEKKQLEIKYAKQEVEK